MSLCDDGFVTVDQLAEADGVRVLTGLISGGADATDAGEAVLGLVAYLGVYPDDGKAARALDRYAEGIEATASGAVGVWPFGAILPSTGSAEPLARLGWPGPGGARRGVCGDRSRAGRRGR